PGRSALARTPCARQEFLAAIAVQLLQRLRSKHSPRPPRLATTTSHQASDRSTPNSGRETTRSAQTAGPQTGRPRGRPCDWPAEADQLTKDGPLTRALSTRGRQKLAPTLQVFEGETQLLRRLSEDGLAHSPLDGHCETCRLGEPGGP